MFRVASSHRVFTFMLAAGLMVSMSLSGAYAQQPGGGGGGGGRRGGGAGGPQLSPEESAKVWQLQSDTVARNLKLSPENGTKLAAAYKTSRESQGKAMREAMQAGGGGGGGGMMAMLESNKAEKGKFETAVKGFLTPEQTPKAVEALGTFNRNADRFTSVLDKMGLEKATQEKALDALNTFVVDSGKAMDKAIESQDMQAMRSSSTELKGKLDDAMGKILSADQVTKWKEGTAAPARRGGGGPGGAGGGGGRRPGGPGGTPGTPPASN